MIIAELLKALTQEYPNGVSFDPMSVRLLLQKFPFEDWQIDDLKAEMFQAGNGLWFSCDMISDDESRLAFEKQAMEWLMEYGCFSVERLTKDFCDVLRHIVMPEISTAFLQYLGFTVVVWEKECHICFLPPPNLEDNLVAISKRIAKWLEMDDGTLAFNDIERGMPHMTAEALERIRERYLPEVYKTEVGGVLCWRSIESTMLPEDFSENLTAIVDTLIELEEKVTPANLEFALNLSYRTRLREEYDLLDDDTFMRICRKYYRGGIEVFNRVRAKDCSGSRKRTRSPNTRFSTLGLQIGAKLMFTKDDHIICTVLDDSNQVEYGGKTWAISTLAMYLLNGSVVNGFAYFSYEGETLLERRLRLERLKR